MSAPPKASVILSKGALAPQSKDLRLARLANKAGHLYRERQL
jgi:hypothetical protein